MKKKVLTLTGALAIAGTVGFGIYQSDASQTEPALSYNEVADLISTEYPGTITEFELDKENNRAVYEIEVKNDGIEYELKVDAHSGEILKFKEEKVASKEKNNEQIISTNEATEIALEKYPGKVKEVELDKDDGRLVYEIEIKNNGTEYELKVDAKSGEILKTEKEHENTAKKNVESKNTAKKNSEPKEKKDKQIIDTNTAIEIALAKYPGKVKEVELDKDDGRLIYEIEIRNNGTEYELDIDAYSGKILKTEKEHDAPKGTTKKNVESKEKKGKQIISANEAIEIALAKFSGKVEEVELDEDDGRLIYEIEIESKEQEAEFEIDAKTGKILDMEIDD